MAFQAQHVGPISFSRIGASSIADFELARPKRSWHSSADAATKLSIWRKLIFFVRGTHAFQQTRFGRNAEEKFLTIQLPRTSKRYVDASNEHDVKSILFLLFGRRGRPRRRKRTSWIKIHRGLDCENNREIQSPVQAPQHQRRRCRSRRRRRGIGELW
jgi:hypothetical protein